MHPLIRRISILVAALPSQPDIVRRIYPSRHLVIAAHSSSETSSNCTSRFVSRQNRDRRKMRIFNILSGCSIPARTSCIIENTKEFVLTNALNRIGTEPAQLPESKSIEYRMHTWVAAVSGNIRCGAHTGHRAMVGFVPTSDMSIYKRMQSAKAVYRIGSSGKKRAPLHHPARDQPPRCRL